MPEPLGSLLAIIFYPVFKTIELIFNVLRYSCLAIKSAAPEDGGYIKRILQKAVSASGLLKTFCYVGRANELLTRIANWREPNNLLIQGKRNEYAQAVYPPSRFPLLYAALPQDLAPSIVQSGRTLGNGIPSIDLPPRQLRESHIENIHARAVNKALLFLFYMMMGAVIIIGIIAFRGVSAPDVGAVAVATLDTWGPASAIEMEDLRKTAQSRGKYVGNVAAGLVGIISFIVLMIPVTLLCILAAIALWVGFFRGEVAACLEQIASQIRIDNRDYLQGFRLRAMDIKNANEALIRSAIFLRDFDRSPTINIGVSRGTMAFRGHLNAPQPGAMLKMSIMDLMTHVAVQGATGEGKTRYFLSPLIGQLLDLRVSGYPIALYVTDGKGVLWRDFLDEASKRGLDRDVRIIGTAPEQYRVDLLDGVPPAVFADVLKSVARQLGGAKGSDDFWPDMASSLCLETGILLEAWEHTPQGTEYIRTTGKRGYSIDRILKVACSFELLQDVVLDVSAAASSQDSSIYMPIARYDTNALWAAMDSVVDFWSTLAESTKTGIQANVRTMLRLFVFDNELAPGFADGAGDNLVSISDLYGNYLTAINVSSIRFGAAGKLVNVMLKTLLFREARAYEERNPKSSGERLQWWSQPDMTMKNVERHALTVFLADEYQDIVTADLALGFSDANFWNVARSSGIAGVVVFQNTAALKQTIGDEPTVNFMSNFNTKIWLRMSDMDSIGHAINLLGKTINFTPLSFSSHNSHATATLDNKVSPDNLPQINVLASSSSATMNIVRGVYPRHFDSPFELDDRFIIGRLDDPVSKVAAQKEAFWRQEDKNLQVLTAPFTENDALKPTDLMNLGRGQALVMLMRAGSVRVDTVDLQVAEEPVEIDLEL